MSTLHRILVFFGGAIKHHSSAVLFIGHPSARVTSQDGQYESGVRERGKPYPDARPAGDESPNITIDLGTVFFDDRSGNFWE